MAKENLSLAGFIMKLANAPQNCKISFLTVTSVEMNKTGKEADGTKIPNPHLDSVVEKEQLLEGLIKFNYASEVNKQRLNEGKDADFVSKERAWGVKDGCFVSHKGNLYIDFNVKKQGKSTYRVNNSDVDKSTLAPFMKGGGISKTQDLINEVCIRTIKLSSVKEATIGTVEYVIV